MPHLTVLKQTFPTFHLTPLPHYLPLHSPYVKANPQPTLQSPTTHHTNYIENTLQTGKNSIPIKHTTVKYYLKF
jgi:hypothetical protein